MSFKRPPTLIQKVIGLRAFQHKNGKLYLFNVPGMVSPLYLIVYLQKLLETNLGYEKAAEIIYSFGYTQSQQGVRIINKKFGYAQTMKDKIDLIRFNTEQTELVGNGHFEWIKLDFEKERFIVKGVCSVGEEYKKFFGQQTKATDHFIRGQAAALIAEITGKEMFSVETRCVTKGHPYCEFLVKPRTEWDKEELKKYQQPLISVLTMKDLNSKIEPYLSSF